MTSRLTPAMREQLLTITDKIATALSELMSAARTNLDGSDDETCARRLSAAAYICEAASDKLASMTKEIANL